MDDEPTDRVSSPTVREGASRIEVAVADDFQRYESAAGWVPPDPYKKQREKIRKQQAELDRTDTMLVTRPASDWHLPVRDRKAYSEELFGPLWRVGEVALLFGQRGVGKSILAVQIAESIARGRPILPVPKGKSRRHAEKVLYVDMQRSGAQWSERHTQPSLIPGKLPTRYQFAKNFDRAGIDWTNVDLDAYKRDPVKYALRSIFNKIEEARAKVVIIDDILLGGATVLGRKGIARTMQTLKMWAATEGLSILVLAQGQYHQRKRVGSSASSPPYESGAPAGASPRGVDVGGVRLRPGGGSLFSSADSIFSIQPSAFGPQYRYIKHLASVSTPPANEVLALQLRGANSPSVSGILDRASCIVHPASETHRELCIGVPPPSSLISNFRYQIPPAAFMYLGSSAEEQHLFDYAAEALHAQRAEERQLKRLRRRRSKEILVDGILDGSYVRYLKGE